MNATVMVIIPLLPLHISAGLLFPSTRPLKRMCLSIQHPFIQADNIRRRIQEIEVLERLREPETLHLIHVARDLGVDVVDGRVAEFRRGGSDDGLEHLPALVLPDLVTGDTVHVPDGFDGFGSGVLC